MCPDLHTLSAYLDGEVAVRWAKEIETHVCVCTDCRRHLQKLRDVSAALGRSADFDSRRSQERVWTRLELYREENDYRHAPFLRRRVTVPLPLVAAAASLIIMMGLGLAFLSARARVGTMKITKEPSGITEVQVQTSIKELQQILGSLDRWTSTFSGVVVIPLPEDTPFVMTGEPILTRDKPQERR